MITPEPTAADERRASEKRLRGEILDRVRELARLREAPVAFSPGRTPVRYAGRVYGEEEMTNLVEAALEFWLTGGRWHFRLEAALASWYGVKHARLVNSGSSANLLATATLMSPLLGERRLRPGDEILTVAAGFPTTVAPAIQLGLKAVFVDITIPTYNADTTALAAAITPRTRAIILAHTLGNPFALDQVTELCRRHQLFLIEDNCDAAGSTFQGKKTGTFGDLATLSFYPPHHMTTGEGGAVLTNDDTLQRALESLRDWGRDCWCLPGVDNTCCKRFEWQLGNLPAGYDHKYTYSHLGFNLKMTDLQAAIGVAQLQRLDAFGQARRRNWAALRNALRDLDDVFVLPEATPGSDPSWFGFMLTVRKDAPFSRDEIVGYLESRKIQTRMLFAGNLIRQPALVNNVYAGTFATSGSLVNSDVVMNQSFWVGVYPGLTEPVLEFVADEIRQFAKSK